MMKSAAVLLNTCGFCCAKLPNTNKWWWQLWPAGRNCFHWKDWGKPSELVPFKLDMIIPENHEAILINAIQKVIMTGLLQQTSSKTPSINYHTVRTCNTELFPYLSTMPYRHFMPQ